MSEQERRQFARAAGEAVADLINEHAKAVAREAAKPRELVVAGFVVRHQVRQYLRALNIEWVEDQSLPGDRVRFEFEATDDQWDDVQAWVERLTP